MPRELGQFGGVQYVQSRIDLSDRDYGVFLCARLAHVQKRDAVEGGHVFGSRCVLGTAMLLYVLLCKRLCFLIRDVQMEIYGQSFKVSLHPCSCHNAVSCAFYFGIDHIFNVFRAFGAALGTVDTELFELGFIDRRSLDHT